MSSIGLEISPSAAAAADKEVRCKLGDLKSSSQATVVQGDFFKWTSSSSEGFDIGYDYTFFCALHPDMREDWAKAWYRHLAPGGKLITLIFPIEDEGRVGPPWPVSHEAYTKVLLPAGFELVSLEAVPEELSHPSRGGREAMGIWQKK